eukprot:794997-Pyramimonas_sp.AAC.1
MGCLPAPFAWRDVPTAADGYTVIIDGRMTGVRANELLALMEQGGFMDNLTRSATAQVRGTLPHRFLSFVHL